MTGGRGFVNGDGSVVVDLVVDGYWKGLCVVERMVYEDVDGGALSLYLLSKGFSKEKEVCLESEREIE